jgi:hypothetical protein
MRGYFGLGQLSAAEKSDILNQHKSIYNGYQTMQPQVSNTQPLTVYDFAGDKEGLVVNNKGEVKTYTNVGINEQSETKEGFKDFFTKKGPHKHKSKTLIPKGDKKLDIKIWDDEDAKKPIHNLDKDETKEVCDECGSMEMYEGVCNECGYGRMEESELDESNMCECGGEMYEGVCNECGYGHMEEETGHLDDIYSVRDLNLKNGDFDYVEGGGNDYGTFEGMHKKLYKESDDDDYMDYESSYTEDDMEDPDNEDDGFEDINSSEVTDGEVYEIDIKDLIKGKKYRYRTPSREDDIEYGDEYTYPEGESMFSFKGKEGTGYALGKKSVEDFINSLDDDSELYEQGGNVDDMDVDDVDSAYNFVSNGPGGVYPVNELGEDDMYGYEPEKMYETMESAWADEELEEGYSDWDIEDEFEIKNDTDLPRGHKHLKKGDNIKLTKKWKNANSGIHGDIFGSDRSEDDYGLSRDDLEMMSNDELEEQPDISGAQGIYGAMKKAYDFDSEGPGKAGPYQEFSYESELDEEDEFEEVDEDLKESFLAQKNKINEMFNRFKKYN